jgi:hypothetical protein
LPPTFAPFRSYSVSAIAISTRYFKVNNVHTRISLLRSLQHVNLHGIPFFLLARAVLLAEVVTSNILAFLVDMVTHVTLVVYVQLLDLFLVQAWVASLCAGTLDIGLALASRKRCLGLDLLARLWGSLVGIAARKVNSGFR